ncbi:MAG: DNA polymerase I, partial [Beggiatoa sp.]|nr:DNA polymerase I [Beggiatoa sp.]
MRRARPSATTSIPNTRRTARPCQEASAAGIATLIASGDKDLAQLVDERVRIANDNTILDAAGVKAKFGVPPMLIVDYLALIGDKTDNIPGVPKVGPKTAVGWLERYGSLDGIIAHAGEIPGKIGENLRAALPDLPLSKRLVTVLRDVPLGVGLEDLAPGTPDIGALKALYTRLEFKTWLGELLAAAPQSAVPEGVVPRYETVLTRAALDAWIERLARADLIAIDTETTSLAYMQARIVGVSFAIETGHAAYVPFGHDYDGVPPQLSAEAVLGALRPILEDPARPKLGHNLKYDMSVFANHGIALSGIRHDSMLESYVLDSTATRHDLDSLALKYLGVRTIHYEDVAGKGTKQVTFNRVPLERAGPYAAEDADVALRLHEAFRSRLYAEPGLTQLYEDIEVPLIGVLSRIERNGVSIDRGMLCGQSHELGRRLRDLEEEAHEAAGMVFNLDSPKQIQEVLFERLRLPATERTPKGQPSTAESVLQDLALDYLLPRLILEYRSLAKLRSTYT